MKKGILKRLLSFLIIACMAIGYVPSVSAIMVDYTPGDILYYLDNSDIISLQGGTIGEDGTLHLEAGAKVTYEFFLPFEANRINFNYERPDDRINVHAKLTMNSYEQTETLNPFYAIQDKKLKRNLTPGDVRLTMEFDRPLELHYVRFEKQPVLNWSVIMEYQAMQGTQFTGAYTEYEKALQIATVINKNSPLVKINGAMKYIDYEDVSEKPLVENGEVYLPINRLANALGYYYEEDYANGYAMLRSDNMEFVLSGGKLLQQINSGAYTEIANNILLKNNTVYVPVSFYAQAMGKSVGYKDDYVVIDYKTRVADIIEGPFFAELQAEFSKYIGNGMSSNVYHVAQTANANDANPGTAEAPFLTLNKAGEVAIAGDTVIVHSGTYRETLKPKNDGTATAPIIFKAAEGENVVISALDEITAVPYEEDGLLVYDMGDWDLGRGENQVFYKGEGIIEARHPNTNTSGRLTPGVEHSKYFPTQGNILVRPDVDNRATSETDLDQEPDFWAGGILISMHYAGYRYCWSEIESSEKGVLYLGDHNPFGYFKDPYFKEDTDNGFITCTKNAIDIPGEWYWGEGKLYMYAPEGETAETLKLEAKKRFLTVDFTDKKNIQVVNINTIGGGVNSNDNTELCVLNGGEHKYVSHFTYLYDTAFWLDYTRATSAYDSIMDDSPLKRGELGICINGKNNAVINSYVRYSAGAGIITGGAYSHIENNYVSDTGYGGLYASGIDINVDEKCFTQVMGGHSILYNTIVKTGRSSIHMGGPNYPSAEDYGCISVVANEIAYNDCRDGMLYSRDGGMVYSYWTDLGNDIAKTKVHHNLVSTAWRDPEEKTAGVVLIYWDNGCLNFECSSNVMYWTDPYTARLGHEFFKQQYNGSRVHTSDITWGQTAPGIVEGGKEALTADDYPQSKIFNSGSTHYEARKNTFELNTVGYNIDNAEVSAGVTMVDNAAALNKAGQSVTFKNVEFGDDYNAFSIIYRGSKNQTGDKVKVTVGDKTTSNLTSEIALTSTAATLKNNVTQPVYIYGCEGTKDITIESTTYSSLEIAGIIPIKADQALIDEYVMGKTFANNYKEIVTDGGVSIVSSADGTSGRAEELAISTVKGGSVIKYSGVEINRDVNNFVLAAGSTGSYAGDILEVRVGDMKSAPIASIAIPNHGNTTFTPVYAELNSILAEGTYDIYLSFTDTSGTKNSNVWWFGFNVTEKEATAE